MTVTSVFLKFSRNCYRFLSMLLETNCKTRFDIAFQFCTTLTPFTSYLLNYTKADHKVRAGQMNKGLPKLVSTGTTLADPNWQGQCENPLYSRRDQNTKEGIELRPLSSQNVTENSNLSTAGLSKEDEEQNDHAYTYIYLGV